VANSTSCCSIDCFQARWNSARTSPMTRMKTVASDGARSSAVAAEATSAARTSAAGLKVTVWQC
jgi:hypothetical protein